MKRNFSLHYQCIFKQKGNKKKDLLPNCLRKNKTKKGLYMPGELHISKSAYPEGWDHLH